ncbi:MAG: 4'-phosphopantetheinyl transferase superfamily protein [Granulosicoccus sp.]|nr:4'-phosphopantetheinyl transferase superfamily protein [Granulosicoccus sp.]
MSQSAPTPDESPINGLDFAPEWAGTNVFLACEPVRDRTSELQEQELAYIQRSMELRRNTFSTGRASARVALANAGIEPVALLRLEDGSVQWPDGIIGSITHTDYWAVSAVALSAMTEATAIGIDLEPIRALDQGVIELIATSEERDEIADQASPAWHATALFSLKESIYKCLRPSYGQFIEFHDVQIKGVASGRPELRFISRDLLRRYNENKLHLRMAVTHDHVFTLVWLHQDHS